MIVSTRFSRKLGGKMPEGGVLTPDEARQPVSNEFADQFPVLGQQLPSIGSQLDMFSKRDSANFNPIYERIEGFLRSDQYDPINRTDIEKRNLEKVSKAFVPPTRRGRALLDHMGIVNQPTEISEGQQALFENLDNVTDEELANVLQTDFSDLKDSGIMKKVQTALSLKPKDVSIGDALDINSFFRSDEGKATYPEVYIQSNRELTSNKNGGKMGLSKFSKGGKVRTMLSEQKRVPVNDLLQFANGGALKKQDLPHIGPGRIPDAFVTTKTLSRVADEVPVKGDKKVNAYNYRRGRPFNKLERFKRRFFPTGGVLDRTVAQDTTNPARFAPNVPLEMEAPPIAGLDQLEFINQHSDLLGESQYDPSEYEQFMQENYVPFSDHPNAKTVNGKPVNRTGLPLPSGGARFKCGGRMSKFSKL